MSARKPRHPMIVAGAIQEAVEAHAASRSPERDFTRLQELCVELQRSLTVKSMEDSLELIQAKS